MIFIPLPFAVTFILLFILALLLREGGMRTSMRPMLLLIAGYALVSFLLGLRWGYGLRGLQPAIAVLAAAQAPLAWLAFRNYARAIGRPDAAHALAPLLVAALIAAAPLFIDLALVAIYLGYGGALLRLGLGSPDALARAPFEYAAMIRRSLIATAIILIGSAFADLAIAADVALAGGAHLEGVVPVANLVGLLILGIAAARIGRPEAAAPEEESALASAPGPSEEDIEVLGKVKALVEEKELFRDPDLTLNRLARRSLIPARRISEAVNRGADMSVSQFINGYRIAEAKRLLSATERPVTAIMFEAGFQTKSNFNRAFLAETGQSPALWRSAQIAESQGN